MAEMDNLEKGAYVSTLNDVIETGWTYIEALKSAVATIGGENNTLPDVIAIVQDVIDDTIISIGMISKASELIDSETSDLMAQGEEKAEQIVDNNVEVEETEKTTIETEESLSESEEKISGEEAKQIALGVSELLKNGNNSEKVELATKIIKVIPDNLIDELVDKTKEKIGNKKISDEVKEKASEKNINLNKFTTYAQAIDEWTSNPENTKILKELIVTTLLIVGIIEPTPIVEIVAGILAVIPSTIVVKLALASLFPLQTITYYAKKAIEKAIEKKATKKKAVTEALDIGQLKKLGFTEVSDVGNKRTFKYGGSGHFPTIITSLKDFNVEPDSYDEKEKTISFEQLDSNSKPVETISEDLSPQQQEYFKDSKVRDSKGNLVPVYHSSYDKFDTFNDGKLMWFALDKDYAKETFGDGKHVYKCYINITKPLMMYKYCDLNNWFFDEDEFGDDVNLCYEDAEVRHNAPLTPDAEKLMEVLGLDRNDFTDLFVKCDYSHFNYIYYLTNSPEFADIIKSKGYDGVFADETWGNRTFGVLYPNQIKRINNKFPTSSNNMSEKKINEDYSGFLGNYGFNYLKGKGDYEYWYYKDSEDKKTFNRVVDRIRKEYPDFIISSGIADGDTPTIYIQKSMYGNRR